MSLDEIELFRNGKPVSDATSVSVRNQTRIVRSLPVADQRETSADTIKLSARQCSAPPFKMTSIVIPTCNQVAYTRQCLDTLRVVTDEPVELIVVDNGSTDGTVAYLRAQPDVTLIENESNRGFPAACNQGVRAASGAQILFLNNDVVPTTGWLRRMLVALHEEPSVAMVGPVSNCVSGEQQIAVGYDDLLSLDGFAWEWGKLHDRERQDTERLVGFCLLVKSDVLSAIGLFDEDFGIGNFEDDDLCRRAKQAGFQLRIACDAFVHHFGSATFRTLGGELQKSLSENQKRFERKWSAKGEQVSRRRLKAERGAGGIRLVADPPALSLCMIARDSSNTLPDCLASIRQWVDEIVLVDTGSVDDTPQIAERFGAKVFSFPWCDDFSAARNESLRRATGEWIFWMDTDDTIDAANGRRLQQLVRKPIADSTLGFVMQVHCPGAACGGVADVTVVDHVKLFRNHKGIAFEGRIHEQVLASIRNIGGQVEWTDLFVVHSGVDHSPAGRLAKQERDLRILEKDLSERPNHPFVLFNLGMTYADMDRHDQAVDFLLRSIEVSRDHESHVRKLYALIVSSYTHLGRTNVAHVWCDKGLALFPDDPELLFRKGGLAQAQREFAEAEHCYRRILDLPSDVDHFSSIDQGILGYKVAQNLAVLYSESGRHADAEQLWRMVTSFEPSYNIAWRGLTDCLIQQRRPDEALQIADELSKRASLVPDSLLIRANSLAAKGERWAAGAVLSEAHDRFPDHDGLFRALCQSNFELGRLDEAGEMLSMLIANHPEDAASHYNLGMVHLQKARLDDAHRCLEKSHQLRPNHAETEEMLNVVRAALNEQLQRAGSE